MSHSFGGCVKTESLPDKWDRVANTLEKQAKRFAGIDDSPEEKWTDTFLGGCATRARQDAIGRRVPATHWTHLQEAP